MEICKPAVAGGRRGGGGGKYVVEVAEEARILVEHFLFERRKTLLVVVVQAALVGRRGGVQVGCVCHFSGSLDDVEAVFGQLYGPAAGSLDALTRCHSMYVCYRAGSTMRGIDDNAIEVS